MALFVQIDHFRKTDQKPTVKNHLFSISWFRRLQSYILSTTTETSLCGQGWGARYGFNRTSFQQQLKHEVIFETTTETDASIVHPFNNNWNIFKYTAFAFFLMLQSYILSTTTETVISSNSLGKSLASIVHPFNNNWNLSQSLCCDTFHKASIVHPFNNNWNDLSIRGQLSAGLLQSYILSTTTETPEGPTGIATDKASIVHPFNNNWNGAFTNLAARLFGFNRTSFQQQLKRDALS